MNEELLDVVDENNHLTGESLPRSEVHAGGLWHRTAHIYLFRRHNSEIEILIHLRSKLKDGAPNTWDTRFGGHVHSGVIIEQGALAELKEELGLSKQAEDFIEGEWRKREEDWNREFTKVFYLEYSGSLDDLHFEDDEVQEVKWMSAGDIVKWMTTNPEQWAGSSKGFQEVVATLQDKLK